MFQCTRSILGIVTIAALTAGLAFAAICRTQSVRAQSPVSAQATPSLSVSLPSFEVVSIKPNHSLGDGMIDAGGPDFSRFTVKNSSVKDLITFAYNMRDFQVSGGPGWIASERFDIEAKVEDSAAQRMRKLPSTSGQAQMRELVRSLLAERFALKANQRTKNLPIYVLVVAKGGPKLKEVSPSDGQTSYSPPLTPGDYRLITGRVSTLTASASPVASLVRVLSQQLGRQLVDETGLKGTYDFTLKWASDMGVGGGSTSGAADSGSSPDTSSTSIFTAIQEQLGLRLKSAKGPVDTLMIERIEEPTPN
jgi:uncharacterized protein (TIGR03435 family)